jgi:putative hydrolase of the HAD superfamily
MAFPRTSALLEDRIDRLCCVIFDFGGVVSRPLPRTFFDAVSAVTRAPSGLLEKSYYDCRHEYDRGMLSGEEYWCRVLERAGTGSDTPDLRRLIDLDVNAWTRINEDVLDLVFRLHAAGVFLALLSNLPADYRDYFARHFPWLRLFSVCVYSCDFGLVKPEPGIYRACLERLRTPPEQCLFVDDMEKNVTAARVLGMRGILFVDAGSLEKELRARLAGTAF